MAAPRTTNVTTQDQISLGISHEITVGRYNEKAWPKAEVTRTVRPDEDFQTALSETMVMLDAAINASIQQAVERIEAHGG